MLFIFLLITKNVKNRKFKRKRKFKVKKSLFRYLHRDLFISYPETKYIGKIVQNWFPIFFVIQVKHYFEYEDPDGTVKEIWRQVSQKLPLINLMINRDKRLVKRDLTEPDCSCLCSNQSGIQTSPWLLPFADPCDRKCGNCKSTQKHLVLWLWVVDLVGRQSILFHGHCLISGIWFFDSCSADIQFKMLESSLKCLFIQFPYCFWFCPCFKNSWVIEAGFSYWCKNWGVHYYIEN